MVIFWSYSRHTFLFSSASSANVNLLIQERSRSVKSIFTVQRKSQPDITIDNGATFFDTALPAGADNLDTPVGSKLLGLTHSSTKLPVQSWWQIFPCRPCPVLNHYRLRVN